MTRPTNHKIGDKFVLNRDYYGMKKGSIVTLAWDDGTDNPYFANVYGTKTIYFDDLSPAKGWDALRVDDVVVDRDGIERKVLATLGTNYLLGGFDDFDMACDWYTQVELKSRYTIKGKSDEVETIEIAGRKYDKQEVEKRLRDLEEI